MIVVVDISMVLIPVGMFGVLNNNNDEMIGAVASVVSILKISREKR